MMDFSDILAALPSLQPDQRARLRQALDQQKGHAALEPPKPSTKIARPDLTLHETEVVNSLRRYMQRRGAEMVVMYQLQTDEQFRGNVTSLYAYIHKHTETKSQRYFLLAIGWELLYRDLQTKGMKFDPVRTMITAQALLRRVHLMPAAINYQFPGYAAAGVLHWIFKKAVDDARDRLRDYRGHRRKNGR